MAVLNVLTSADAFPGGDRVLARHRLMLPQPDQLCGPFAASIALCAVTDSSPSVLDLAIASGTCIWPHDVPHWRPVGAPMLRVGWDVLPEAESPKVSGTNASGLRRGVHSRTAAEAIVLPVTGRDLTVDTCGALLERLLSGAPVGVVANVDTGALDPESGWSVGHFVVVWGYRDGVVGIADTYLELGAPGSPPGCREVTVDDLVAGVSAQPGRGILVLTSYGDVVRVAASLDAAQVTSQLWTT